MRGQLCGNFRGDLLLNVSDEVPPLVSEQLLHSSEVYTTHSTSPRVQRVFAVLHRYSRGRSDTNIQDRGLQVTDGIFCPMRGRAGFYFLLVRNHCRGGNQSFSRG